VVNYQGDKLDIAVIGTGIAGLSAAWLLNRRHTVTVYEKAPRLGGHANTVMVPSHLGGASAELPVDMGFIVYNPETYPNLSALFRLLDVPTQASEMSFAVSLRDGGLEYAGTTPAGLFAQKRNVVNPRFWSMLRDLARFYRQGTEDARRPLESLGSLAEYLAAGGYGEAFIRDHLLPMAAAIWSTPCDSMLDYPAGAFLRFCDNHGLLRLTGRPEWRTVTGGSRAYVERLSAPFSERIRTGVGVRSIRRLPDGVEVLDDRGATGHYDHVVIAVHADQALAMLSDPSDAERALLGALRYGANDAVMHRDPTLMPRRRRAWCSWNYLGGAAEQTVCATYWMNRLQSLPVDDPLFVTLNPHRQPAPETVIRREAYEHPMFDGPALHAQRELWSLQGARRSWFCGAYFGAGFHEDGLQAGLAVAEALGGQRRPWTVPGESGRIPLGAMPQAALV
jgi:predicted NAD/FAD-binding protein